MQKVRVRGVEKPCEKYTVDSVFYQTTHPPAYWTNAAGTMPMEMHYVGCAIFV